MRICCLLLLSSTLASCGQFEWPPHKSEFRELFAEMRATFVSVEEEMRKDDLVELTRGHLDGTERERLVPVQSPLTEAQRIKYKALLGDRAGFLFQAESTYFSANTYIPTAHNNHYTFWFVRSDSPHEPQICTAEMKQVACGGCSIAIDSEWFMSWSWFPDDVDLMDESCRHLRDDN